METQRRSGQIIPDDRYRGDQPRALDGTNEYRERKNQEVVQAEQFDEGE